MSLSALARYHAGLEAERAVAREYLRRGCKFAAHRFRAASGEIDLIMQGSDCTIFIEVKKSRSHARAADALSGAQVSRIIAAATEYAENLPNGLDSEMRFDIALVDNAGHIEILENALSA